MAFGIFLNFEKLSIQIIENELSYMTNDNMAVYNDRRSDFIDDEAFSNNLYHGVIAATFIVNLYETALNTIIGRRLGCSEIDILKTSHRVKLQLICTMYGVDLESIKSINEYSILQNMIKVRNDITHYKYNEICQGMWISKDTTFNSGASKESVTEVFTERYMRKGYEGVFSLLKLICEKCGLIIYSDCPLIDCDGRDELCEFIVTKETYENSERLD